MSKKTTQHKRLSASKKNTNKRRSAKLSKKLVFVFLGSAVAVLLGIIVISASVPQFCANSFSCIKDLSGRLDPLAKSGVFEGRKVSVPDLVISNSLINPSAKVLGENTGIKQIKVDLSTQHLYAYQGDKLLMDFPVSTGKWHKTPTGTFNIWVKLRYTRMTGGDPNLGTFYDLPNVPYTMFFYNDDVSKSQGFSIHGAYWHNNFGHPMSHGCVNMRIVDAQQVFAWADPQTTGWNRQATEDNPGTQIVIYGTTPSQ